MTTKKGILDTLFDLGEKAADFFESQKAAEERPESDPDVVDAEIVQDSVDVIIAQVGATWHLFRGVTTRTFHGETIPAEQITNRKRLPAPTERISVPVCLGCIAGLFTPIQPRKELSSGD